MSQTDWHTISFAGPALRLTLEQTVEWQSLMARGRRAAQAMSRAYAVTASGVGLQLIGATAGLLSMLHGTHVPAWVMVAVWLGFALICLGTRLRERYLQCLLANDRAVHAFCIRIHATNGMPIPAAALLR